MESELSGKIGIRTGSDLDQKRRARGKNCSSVQGQHGWSTEAVSISLSVCLPLSSLSLTHTPDLVLKGWGLGMQLNWKSTCLACTKPWVPSQCCQPGVQCQHSGSKGRRSTSLRSADKKEEKQNQEATLGYIVSSEPTGPQREAEYPYGRVKISRAQDQVGSKVTRSG